MTGSATVPTTPEARPASSIDERERRRLRRVLVLAGLCLTAGLMLPILVVDTLTGEDPSSILSGLVHLIEERRIGLALVIFGFSIVFPIAKITVLARILAHDGDHHVALGRLALAGKWSMLDVCVVIVFASAVQLGFLAEARTGPGMIAFSIAVLLTMIATGRLRRRLGEAPAEPPAGRAPLVETVLAFAGLAALVVGLVAPSMEVDKWLFWSNEASVASSLVRMVAGGELVPAVLFAVFVVLLPLAHGALSVRDRLQRRPSVADRLRLELLGEWALHDVYALALILFWIKAGESATVEPRLGFASMLAAAVLTIAGRALAARRHSSRPMPKYVPGRSGG